MRNYVNYHSHTMYSNISTPDSTISNKDRLNRVLELQQTVLSGVEHGWCGRFIETIELAKQKNIKPLIGAEVYFVKDRFEKDSTNAHLILLAKNENGRKAINKILSEANTTGYYYKPRCDKKLVFSLPANDVWVTSACLGGVWKYEDSDSLVVELSNYFGNNFFLEVQNHNVDKQVDLNKKILDLSNRYDIKIIAGMDSHMNYPSQARERNDYLLSRGISYPDEENWFLDFPSYEEAFNRFMRQGVLSKSKIDEALDNTNIFQDVGVYDSPIFDANNVKLPSLYSDKNQEQKDKLLCDIVWQNWKDEKINVDQSKWPHYESEIQKELDVVIKTKMADYFLLDYEIIRLGKEKGGSITLTGRGSAPSYYLSKLLGFTTIDRIGASVRLFPERFISAERIIESKTLPDIDMNLGTVQIFADAQAEILGDGHSYPMLAFGTVKTLGAWKLYARTAGVPFDISNTVSEQIQKYENAMKHAESDEDKEAVDIHEYVEDEFFNIYEESKKYLGLVNTLTPHPCAYLLYNQGDIREEFGLIKIKTGGTEHICACCDGLFAENYKLLKNDLLKVSVVELIYRVYDRIGMKPHAMPELIKMCNNNEKVLNIYKNAWTIGINQFEQSGTAHRASKYAPKNISEITAMVAAVRPGFKSNYSQFESRKPFSYGVSSLDDLIQTEEFPYSYMLYQENTMAVLAYAGIPIAETYTIIKNIAKKRADKVLKYKEIFMKGITEKIIERDHKPEDEAAKIAQMTWQVIEDSSRYSFNSSHAYSVAGDSLYGAYLKSHYPLYFYEVFLQMMEEGGDKDRLAQAKVEAEEAFGIKFPPYEFGQDNRNIRANPDRNEITSSLASIKGFNNTIGENMYYLSQFEYDDFVDFLIKAEEEGKLSSKIGDLIKIDFFKKFGKNSKLLKIFEEFTKGENKYSRKHSEKTKAKRVVALKEMFANLPDSRLSFWDQVMSEQDILGYIQVTCPNLDKRFVYVMSLDEKFAPRVQLYNLATGKQMSIKVQKKLFENKNFLGGDILYCKKFEKKNAVKFDDGKYVEVENEFAYWLRDYEVVSIEKLDEALSNA